METRATLTGHIPHVLHHGGTPTKAQVEGFGTMQGFRVISSGDPTCWC